MQPDGLGIFAYRHLALYLTLYLKPEYPAARLS
jgi:hypothetical protein